MLYKERNFRNDIMLASFTATTAGMTNIAGVMACYAFTSNVTGHAVHFAKHMLTGNFFEMLVVFGWMMTFIFGAGFAHFLIRFYEYKGPYFAHSLPIIVVLLLFGGGGGYYGYSRYGGRGAGGIVGTVLIVLLVIWLLGGVQFYHS